MRLDEYNKDLNFLIIADQLADTVHVNYYKNRYKKQMK
jgi:hypothetical protein